MTLRLSKSLDQHTTREPGKIVVMLEPAIVNMADDKAMDQREGVTIPEK
jgi:hypothetical protein